MASTRSVLLLQPYHRIDLHHEKHFREKVMHGFTSCIENWHFRENVILTPLWLEIFYCPNLRPRRLLVRPVMRFKGGNGSTKVIVLLFDGSILLSSNYHCDTISKLRLISFFVVTKPQAFMYLERVGF